MLNRLNPAIDFFVHARQVGPEDRMQLRFLAGCLLLGMAVALASAIEEFALGAPSQSAFVMGFAGVCLAMLLAVRSHLQVRTLWLVSLIALGGFLSVQCMQPPKLEGGTLKWLVLLPLLLLLYLDGAGVGASGARRDGAIWKGAAVAIAFAGFVALAYRQGWTVYFRHTTTPVDTPWVEQLVDSALFIVSVSGLLSLHRIAVRRLEEELSALRSILRVCAWCRRIHDEHDEWVVVERYMMKHSNRMATHGICPDCERKTQDEAGDA